jgi:hypothetical protein
MPRKVDKNLDWEIKQAEKYLKEAQSREKVMWFKVLTELRAQKRAKQPSVREQLRSKTDKEIIAYLVDHYPNLLTEIFRSDKWHNRGHAARQAKHVGVAGHGLTGVGGVKDRVNVPELLP